MFCIRKTKKIMRYIWSIAQWHILTEIYMALSIKDKWCWNTVHILSNIRLDTMKSRGGCIRFVWRVWPWMKWQNPWYFHRNYCHWFYNHVDHLHHPPRVWIGEFVRLGGGFNHAMILQWPHKFTQSTCCVHCVSISSTYGTFAFVQRCSSCTHKLSCQRSTFSLSDMESKFTMWF